MSFSDELKKEIQGAKGLVGQAKKQLIPSGKKLAQQAWDYVSFAKKNLTPDDVIANFDNYLCELVDTEYQIYLEYEERCANQGVFELALNTDFTANFPNVRNLMDSAIEILRDASYSDVKKLAMLMVHIRPFYKFVEQSFAQGRMSRAGGSPQHHLERLFELAGYSGEFEMQQQLNGTVDFLFPSLDVWQRDRRRCVIVSIKRSLRERYKEVFEELDMTGGITVYLAATETYEEAKKDITKSQVDKIDRHNIYIVVRDEIKQKRFFKESNVIGFSKFISEELPNRRAQWRPLLV